MNTVDPSWRAVLASRSLLALAVGAVIAGLLTGCVGATPLAVNTIEKVDFDTPLAIPELDTGTLGPDGVREFDLVAAEGVTEFRPGVATETAGFNGSYLGPTLAATVGEQVRVRMDNQLSEATTVHWHGMHLPAEMDGGPHQMVAPGETWTPTWRIDQNPATLWYHPHLHGKTEEHVERGLAGMFLLNPDDPGRFGLPHRYGVDDIPVIVQDKSFTSDGQFHTQNRGFVGALGQEILVNGTLAPYLDVTTDAVRLRLLNGSTARVYEFGFDDQRTFDLIGTDGGLLEALHELTSIRLSPGERAEIIVRMASGEETVLRSVSPDLGIPAPLAAVNGGSDRFDVLQLRAAGDLETLTPVADAFDDLPRIDPSEAVQVRQFDMNGLQINGQSMQMVEVNEVVQVGTAEIWEVRNGMQLPHSFHVHDVQFQILDIDGVPPPPELAGWKDTVFTEPELTYRLAMRFEDYADDDTPYMYHCHFLMHEDAGMMGQFTVVEDPASAPVRLADPGHGSHH